MTITLAWADRRDEFDALCPTDGQSSLLQCWAWGEAKREVEGWHPRRAILARGPDVIGAVQILEKRLGPVRVARINRGPFWVGAHDPDPAVKAAALACLRGQWRWWRGRALLIAPELAADAAADLPGLGFHRRAGDGWCSAWVDLRRSDGDLRKSLHGKWRNMLVNAEKAGLDLDLMAGPDAVDWLMPLYRSAMEEKGFSGASPAMMQALARHAAPDDMLVYRVRSNGDEAAALLMARHGVSVTYLVGCTGPAGRASRATYLALWRAMLDLRDRGCHWLDLGGIDDQSTPGVAAFKRGVKGSEYRLAGEFWSL